MPSAQTKPDNDSYQLKTTLKENVKKYYVFDGSARMTDVYEARSNAAHGDTCLHTQYVYDGATFRIQKSKEQNATWDSAWEIV